MLFGPSISTFRTTSTVVFGRGASKELPDHLRRTGAGKVLIVTDPGVVKAGLLERVEAGLRAAGLEFSTWAHAVPEPPSPSVDACAEAIKAYGPAVVVGLGGGSAMDTSQIAACVVTNGGKAEDWLGVEVLKRPGIPTISVPTTAGTASEVTGNAVMLLADGSNKMAVVSPFIYPQVAVIDPAFTDTLPPRITAATGMDTFCHASESFISVRATEHTRMYAADAMRRVMRSLPAAVRDGSNAEARDDMSYACLMAGYTLANAGTVIVHAMAHVIGARTHTPHGICNTICLLPLMDFFVQRVPERIAGLAASLGVADAVTGDRARAQAALVKMRELVASVDLPTRLRDIGLDHDDLPDIAHVTAGSKRLMSQSPAAASEDELVALLEGIY